MLYVNQYFDKMSLNFKLKIFVSTQVTTFWRSLLHNNGLLWKQKNYRHFKYKLECTKYLSSCEYSRNWTFGWQLRFAVFVMWKFWVYLIYWILINQHIHNSCVFPGNFKSFGKVISEKLWRKVCKTQFLGERIWSFKFQALHHILNMTK